MPVERISVCLPKISGSTAPHTLCYIFSFALSFHLFFRFFFHTVPTMGSTRTADSFSTSSPPMPLFMHLHQECCEPKLGLKCETTTVSMTKYRLKSFLFFSPELDTHKSLSGRRLSYNRSSHLSRPSYYKFHTYAIKFAISLKFRINQP